MNPEESFLRVESESERVPVVVFQQAFELLSVDPGLPAPDVRKTSGWTSSRAVACSPLRVQGRIFALICSCVMTGMAVSSFVFALALLFFLSGSLLLPPCGILARTQSFCLEDFPVPFGTPCPGASLPVLSGLHVPGHPCLCCRDFMSQGILACAVGTPCPLASLPCGTPCPLPSIKQLPCQPSEKKYFF